MKIYLEYFQTIADLLKHRNQFQPSSLLVHLKNNFMLLNQKLTKIIIKELSKQVKKVKLTKQEICQMKL
jgi:hypothetical protein